MSHGDILVCMSLQYQFAYTHQVLADYMDKFDNYANFKDMI